MINPVIKKIYKKIKKYNTIVIARHIGPDPDAVCSQIALRDTIKATFPSKNVYAVGMSVSRFKSFGTLDKINEEVYNAINGSKLDIIAPSIEGNIIEDLPVRRESKYKAYINIQLGCDKFCTYCIVPYTRGKQRSRMPEDIISEVKKLKENGYMEVTLLGQNVNAYGKDFKDRNYKMENSGVLHCVPFNKELVRHGLENGLYMGFGGTCTFKNSKNFLTHNNITKPSKHHKNS